MRESSISPPPEDSLQTAGYTPDSRFPPMLMDWSYLHQISDDNPEFERELLQIFVEHTEPHLADMSAAIAAANYQDLEQQAHYVKGSSGNLGILSMYEIATDLENQARQRHLDQAIKQVAALQHMMDEVKRYLEEGEGGGKVGEEGEAREGEEEGEEGGG